MNPPKITIVLFGILLIVLMFGLVSGQIIDTGSISSGSVGASKYMNVVCDVTLWNQPYEDVVIDKHTCQVTPSGFCINVLPFSLFRDVLGLYDEGTVSLQVGGAVDQKPFKVFEAGSKEKVEFSKTYELSVKCVPTTYKTGIIKAVVEDVIVDSKTLTLGGQ